MKDEKVGMSRYWTMIFWVDPNGYGVISEYSYKGVSHESAKFKALKGFDADTKKMYGALADVEVKKVETVKITSGLQNQRRWGNPR